MAKQWRIVNVVCWATATVTNNDSEATVRVMKDTVLCLMHILITQYGGLCRVLLLCFQEVLVSEDSESCFHVRNGCKTSGLSLKNIRRLVLHILRQDRLAKKLWQSNMMLLHYCTLTVA